MSTQLILYPQSHEGRYSSNSAIYSFLVDGINFNTINAATSYDATNTPSNLGIEQAIVFQNATGIIVNTWYRVRSNWTGSPALPLASAGNLVLDSVSPGSFCGVYQRLSNLVVGGVYNVTVDMTPIAGSTFYIQSFNGTTLNPMSGGTAPTTQAQATYSFTAQSPTDIVAFWQSSSITSSLTISNISVQTSAISPTQVFTDLIDGQVICDLYEEEDIPLTLSIDDFKNVAEQVKSYSKDFNLPATKRNNKIFNNMFEVTRADDGLIFNPYVRTKCVLKQDGFILFEGYLRLIDAKDKEGEISYNVNLYSEVIALADILKDSTFSDLGFTELTHAYNKTQIKYSWEGIYGSGVTYLNPSTSGFRTSSTVKYPFIDWTHQYIIAATTGTPTAGNPQLPSLETAFRPCIQLKYLINRIFAAAGFNWTSNFFDSADFEKLYMDFNWGSNEFGTEETGGDYSGPIGSLPTVYSSATFQSVALASNNFDSAMGWDDANNRFVAVNDNTTYDLNAVMYMGNAGTATTLSTRFARYSSGGAFIQEYDLQSATANNGIGVPPRISQTEAVIDSGDYLQFEWKTTVASDGYLSASALVLIFGTTGSLIVTTNTFLQTLRGETGQWEFLKGIMTMFNLVSLVDESNPDNILIEPYNDIFINNTAGTSLGARSIQHDWTDKIDASQMELKPLTDLNKKTTFKFVEDDDDYAFNVFKKAQSGHLYGSLEYSASGFTILEGTEEIIAEPFAATVSKPIDSQFSSFIVPSLYARNDDGTYEGFDNSPRIFYNNGVKSTGASYYIPAQNGLSSENQTNFLQFSHLSDVPVTTGTRDFVFASSQLPLAVAPNGPSADNLFSIYWQPYFNELYNADTRIMTIKVNLSPSDVASFKFYDTVFIKNRVFRVNKIEYKPNSLATVEFILIP